ncbi:hypothetical protein G7Y89_g12234 [Cudoniella acicularis]|uniref:Heterokaryon incompatibility domain-containing protein n=1 Tax=Cudoniella acicularis TaxID=354080 RepID=A0A8H4RBX6_9HELO|nr:hypothetical protein G7Y89_g12234 [Cudoniella acicularis]
MRNLDNALRVLRNHDTPRCLWIDALCINQKDDAEKSVQVALMGSIYSKALRVVIWLGAENESPNSALAMSTLRSIKAKSDIEKLSDVANEAIGALFSRPWFSRVGLTSKCNAVA